MTTATEVKERPILFSAPMVRAILEGRKTQTRRIVKVPTWGEGPIELEDKRGMGQSAIDWPNVACKRTGCLAEIPCPYGWRGDHLRALTTWAVEPAFNKYKPKELEHPSVVTRIWYGPELDDVTLQRGKLRPGRFLPKGMRHHMPLLENLDVRVERVQDISNDDALREGIKSEFLPGIGIRYGLPEWPHREWNLTPRGAFLHLFYGLNERADLNENPWVWVIDLRRVRP